jgi:hypothetical protein
MNASVDVWSLLQMLRPGTVVRVPDGSICEVRSFDLTRSRWVMPVVLRCLVTGREFTCTLPEITGVLVDVDHQEPGGRPPWPHEKEVGPAPPAADTFPGSMGR